MRHGPPNGGESFDTYLSDTIKDRQVKMCLSALARRYATDYPGTIGDGVSGIRCSLFVLSNASR